MTLREIRVPGGVNGLTIKADPGRGVELMFDGRWIHIQRRSTRQLLHPAGVLMTLEDSRPTSRRSSR